MPGNHDTAMTAAHLQREKVFTPGTCPIEYSLMIGGYECTKCSWFGYDADEAKQLFGIAITNRYWKDANLPNGEWEVAEHTHWSDGSSVYNTVVRGISREHAKALAERHNAALTPSKTEGGAS